MIKVYGTLAIIALAFGCGWYLSSIVAEQEKKHALAALESSLTQKFAEQKAITEGVSNDYQKQLAALNRRVRSIRLHNGCNKMSAPTKTNGRNAGSTGAIIAGTYAVDSGELITYAEDAEKYRLQLMACQRFVDRIYEANK